MPELDSRQVWVNVSPGLNDARSGILAPLTCAAGWQAAAVAVRFGARVGVGGIAVGVAVSCGVGVGGGIGVSVTVAVGMALVAGGVL